MGPVSIGVEVQRNTDGDTPSNIFVEVHIYIFERVILVDNFVELSVTANNKCLTNPPFP